MTVKSVVSLMVLISSLMLTGCHSAPTANFQHLTLPQTPNYYLVCPKDYCDASPGAYSPVYPISADALFDAWNQIIVQKPRVSYQYSMPAQGEFVLLHVSYFLSLPNDITVQFIALGDQQSTLAILSQSRYGFYDFGFNKRRIDQWLIELNNVITKRDSR